MPIFLSIPGFLSLFLLIFDQFYHIISDFELTRQNSRQGNEKNEFEKKKIKIWKKFKKINFWSKISKSSNFFHFKDFQ